MPASLRRISPRALPVTVIAAALTVLVLPTPPAAAGCAYADVKPSKTSLANVERATRCLINGHRERRGRRSLKGHSKLAESAQRHSHDMDRRNYFSHTSRNGDTMVDRIRRTGYLSGSTSWSVGENIAWYRGSGSTPKAIVKAWMASSGHRAAILKSSFRHFGVGIVRGAPKGSDADAAIYTTDFGRN